MCLDASFVQGLSGCTIVHIRHHYQPSWAPDTVYPGCDTPTQACQENGHGGTSAQHMEVHVQ